MKNNLRIERARLRLTQQELANRVGVSRQTINSLEVERYIPYIVLALKISIVSQKTVNDIFILEEDENFDN